MDFQKSVTEYFESRTKDEPSAMHDDDVMFLMDLSRQDDLSSRSSGATPTVSGDVDTDGVEQGELNPSSLEGRQEPATDSAISTQVESSPGESPAEFTDGVSDAATDAAEVTSSVNDTTEQASFSQLDKNLELDIEANRQASSEQIGNEFNDPEKQDSEKQAPAEPLPEPKLSVEEVVPDSRFSERDASVSAFDDGFRPTDKHIEEKSRDTEAFRNKLDEDVVTRKDDKLEIGQTEQAELERLASPDPDIHINDRFKEYIPDDFPLDFNKALLHIEEELRNEVDSIEIVESGFEIPDLTEIPAFVYQRDTSISRISRQMMERERL